MLAGFGADLTVEEAGGERIITIRGEAELQPQQITVPGDPSSAAFWAVAASIVPESDIVIANVGLNPTRAGLVTVPRALGADIEAIARRMGGGDPGAGLDVRHARSSSRGVPGTQTRTGRRGG